MRPKIKAILEQEYLKWSDTVVREGFNKQAKRIERAFKQIGNIPKRFQQLTEADLTLIKNLKTKLLLSSKMYQIHLQEDYQKRFINLFYGVTLQS